jgi:PadR family transcriptional regulator, regulatory protein PadR
LYLRLCYIEESERHVRELKKGSLNLLVLHLLYERPSYGWDICERLRERSQGTLSFEDGAVYPLLHALERDGLAEGYWETETDEGENAARKSARRRYYRLTPKGRAALRAALQDWSAFTNAVGRVLGDSAIAGEEGPH